MASKPSKKKRNPAEVVMREYGHKNGLVQKIHHLWDNCYRVNYHKDDIIVESHFVTVVNNKAIET